MNELEDFESFLESDFNKFKFTNDLLLGTNDHDVEKLDIETSIKKLTFDLDEVEKRMIKLSSNHYEELISNFLDIEATNNLMTSKITPSLERVNNSFHKVDDEIIKPYDESVKMSQALKKIHTTLDLLRGSNFFFMIVSQIDELEKHKDDTSREIPSDDKLTNNSSNNNNDKNNNIIKLCRMYRQVNNLLNDNNEELLSIQIIRDYQVIHNTKNHQLLEEITNIINNEINHSVKFNVGNNNLKNHLIGYFFMTDKILSILDRTSISKRIQTNLNQLTRSLQSPRNFNQIIKEVNIESTEYLNKLSTLLKQCEIFEVSKSLLDFLDIEISELKDCKQHKINNLYDFYWYKLLTGFEKNLVSTMKRGGPIAKNLKIYYQGIKNSISEIYKDNERDLFLKTIDIIVT